MTIMNDDFVIEVSNLVKRFGEQTVLDGVNLKVMQGETMVMVLLENCPHYIDLASLNILTAVVSGPTLRDLESQEVGFQIVADKGRDLTSLEGEGT